ncbi:MAG: hypothetical protein H7Y37_05865 [Anaerolineae bacterium]|nr:hypothetical protein [Gloeobacterales cyanobacterium ES-bin-313]
MSAVTTSAFYLLLFLVGVALLGQTMLASKKQNRAALFRQNGLLWGTYLSFWGLLALSLQIAYGRWFGHPPVILTAHLSVLLASVGGSLSLGTLLLILLEHLETSQVAVVTSAFIPIAGSGLSGRIQLFDGAYSAVCPGWIVERPQRGDKVRCISLVSEQEYLVVLKNSVDEKRWLNKKTPETKRLRA